MHLHQVPQGRRAAEDEPGFEVMNTTPEQFERSCRNDFEVITRRIRELGVEAQ